MVQILRLKRGSRNYSWGKLMLKPSVRNVLQRLPTPPARSQPAARCQPRSALLWLPLGSGRALSSSYRQQRGKQERRALTSEAHLHQRGMSSFCSFPSHSLRDVPSKRVARPVQSTTSANSRLLLRWGETPRQRMQSSEEIVLMML